MRVLFRCDGSTRMGTGHLMRCLALAQACQDEGDSAQFVLAAEAHAFSARLSDEKILLHLLNAEAGSADDAAKTIAFYKAGGADWVVVDGYHFDAAYQRTLTDAGLKVLWVDDFGHVNAYSAELVLNQNLYAAARQYSGLAKNTRLLLGGRFALLRREFMRWSGCTRVTDGPARKVLVTLGGSDPDNVTLKVIEALGKVPQLNLEANIVVGGSNPHQENLRQRAAENPRVKLLTNVRDMPALMADSDFAICAGGSTCWELAFMGLPGIVIVLADNQVRLAESIKEAGAGLHAGCFQSCSAESLAQMITTLATDSAARKEMSRRAQELVDGGGASRVLMAMSGRRIRLRSANAQDARQIFDWANDPVVREVSFSSKPIVWDEHVAWFNKRLLDPDCVYFIALNEMDRPAGQLRFDVRGREAVVSVSVDASSRGRGLGTQIIQQGSARLFCTRPAVKLIRAYIKPGNTGSTASFRKAGYADSENTTVKGHEALHLILHRSTRG